MGYYTNFKLTIEPEYQEDKVIDWIRANKITDESGWFEYIIDVVQTSAESAKWYDHDKHMLEVSEAFPELIFTLRGWGEEHEDIWKTVYTNGELRHQKAKISFED